MSGKHSAEAAVPVPYIKTPAPMHRRTFQPPTKAALAAAYKAPPKQPTASASKGRSIRNVVRAGVFLTAVSIAGVTALPAYAMMPTGTNPVASTVNAGGTFVDEAVAPAQTYDVDAGTTVAALSVSRDAFAATDPAVLQAARDAEAAAAAKAAAEAAAAAAKAAEPAESDKPSTPQLFAPPQGDYSGAAVVAYAEQFVGVVPYGWGADPSDSFGCDGLTQYVFGKFGISLPRGVDHQAALATQISRSDAQAGDLVVWPGEHIGIYDGAGGIIHSPDFGRYVEHAHSLWGSPVFYRL